MNLCSPFIHRPIATSLLALGLTLAGLVSFKLLPIASLPRVDFPSILVITQLPGANPKDMASSVTAPLERYLGKIAGVSQMTSSSALGLSRISLQFDLNRNIDGAARDVQSAINAAQSELPPNLPTRPTYRKMNPADTPILILALTSNTLSTGKIYDTASTIIQQKIAQIEGVGQVTLGGSSLPAIRIELDLNAVNQYQMSLPTIASRVGAANVNAPKGHFANNIEISTPDQLFKQEEYANLIIDYADNHPVRLSDMAQVIESVEDVRNAGLFNGKKAVFLAIFKEPGANVIETVDRINATMAHIKAIIPAQIELNVALDRTKTIRSSLHEVELTLIIAMILVMLVTYYFLGNIRAMLIPGLVVPLSLLGTFCVMKLLGYSLNNISFMALIISTGFVVDDAVVVVENVIRHLELGKKPMQAALEGAKEVSFTVISMSVSLIAVFIPILFMGGLIGRLFREFAITLSIAILISMIISLTITPVMCSRFLRLTKQKPNHVLEFYKTSLAWALSHERWIIRLTLLAFIVTGLLAFIIPKGFFPQQDIGQINGLIQTDQALSFQALEKKLNQMVDIIQADPAVQDITGILGSTSSTSPGSIYITLKPRNQRDASANEVINRLRSKLANITGTSVYLQAAQDLMIGGRQSNAQFQYTLSGDELNKVNLWATRLVNQLKTSPLLIDVSSDQRDKGLQMDIVIDYDAALRLGITNQLIDETLYTAFGQRQISTIETDMNQYHVVMEAKPRYGKNPSTLNELYILSPTQQPVPLSAIAQFKPLPGLLLVNHQGQAPSATISFNLMPGVSLDKALLQVDEATQQIKLPKTIQGTFQGSAQQFKASLANEPYLILAAILSVYIVLGILYESLIHPLTILSTIPTAGVGALLALLISHTELNIIALIGIILLIGIVKKNAIMMIDFALDAERIELKSPREAIYEAATLRFRPIMMTTCAAMFGAIPLILGFGLGAELRRPLGITILGGLLVSQWLTLYTTPVIYLFMQRLKGRSYHVSI